MTEVTSSTTVILGAGQAGGETAFALRQQGYTGRIVIVGNETHLPYRRPPLSKAFLAGQADAASLLIRQADAYDKANIELRLGTTAEAIDRTAHTITLNNGETLAYDHLVLATGGRVRRLDLPGADAANVLYLRDITDAERLRATIAPDKRLVVIGGGYIGLEVAASAVKAGANVTVLEAAPRLLARVAQADLSTFFEALHRTHGVDVQTGVNVSGFETENGTVTAVLAGERRIEADVVVVGIGLIPNTDVAQTAGLVVDDGIVVDEFARTSDAAVLAVGDCAHHVHPALGGRRIRLESVPSASEMAKVAASVIIGTPKAIAAAPWFWSDQFDAKLQMVGMTDGHDAVVERRLPDNAGAPVFMLCYLREGCLVAIASINRAQEFMAARELVGRHARVDPVKLADPQTPLKDLLATL